MSVTMIGITGPKRTGKDTLCQFLVDVGDLQGLTFGKASLIQPFRDFADSLFGEVKDKEKVLEPFGFTWRHFMQVGCDKIMELHPDVFYLTAVNRALSRRYSRAVFTDVRHERSAELIREAGGKIIHLNPEGFVRKDMHESENPLNVQPGDFVFSYAYGDYEEYQRRAKIFATTFIEGVFK